MNMYTHKVKHKTLHFFLSLNSFFFIVFSLSWCFVWTSIKYLLLVNIIYTDWIKLNLIHSSFRKNLMPCTLSLALYLSKWSIAAQHRAHTWNLTKHIEFITISCDQIRICSRLQCHLLTKYINTKYWMVLCAV